jgi:AcrR family transcriptional regulator
VTRPRLGTLAPVSGQRRSSEEVRSLLISAAVELFAEKGYAGATTREIADRAGVSGTLLFRNFGGKAGLFRAAVIQPLDDFLQAYTEGWRSPVPGPGDPDAMIRTFVEGLYDLARVNRQLLLATVSEHLGANAQTALGRLDRMATETAERYGYVYDAPIAVRAAVAMVVSLSAWEEDLFPADALPSHGRIVDELTELLLRGLTRSR